MQSYKVYKYFGNDNLDDIIISFDNNPIDYQNITDLFFIFYVYELNLVNLDQALFCGKEYINTIGLNNLKIHELIIKNKYNL